MLIFHFFKIIEKNMKEEKLHNKNNINNYGLGFVQITSNFILNINFF